MPTYDPVIGGGTITSGFGGRASPGGIGSTNHKGIDIAAPTGTGVVAPTDIKITSAGWSGGYGNLIRGMDTAGNTYEFGHLSQICVSPGQTVVAGTQIGAVGSTGNSTGPHLHFGIKDAVGDFINPKAFLDKAQTLGKAALAKGAKALADAGIKAAIASQPEIAVAMEAAKLLGIQLPGQEKECGDLDFICKLQKWLKDSQFFARFGMVIIGIIFLIAAFMLLSRGQITKTITQAVKG